MENKQISEGFVLDYNAEGNLVGIDIDNTSKKVRLKKFTLSTVRADILAVAN